MENTYKNVETSVVAQIYAGYESRPYSVKYLLTSDVSKFTQLRILKTSWFFLKVPVCALSLHEVQGLLEVPL